MTQRKPNVPSQGFWAGLETYHWPARFDFVEESVESLWDWDRGRNAPCRCVLSLRGFIKVTVTDELEPSELQVAIGRNLQPHEDCSSTCPAGNPIHPMYSVTHCLWRFQRPGS